MNSLGKRKRRLSAIAGILMLVAGCFNIFWLVGAFTRILDIKELLRITWVISPLPYIILDIGFGGSALIASVLAIIFILAIFLCIFGGAFALRGKTWRSLLIGSVGAFICIPLLGIIVLIITLTTRKKVIRAEKP